MKVNKFITPLNVGIEDLFLYSPFDQEENLPNKYSLLPNGEAIESHLKKLYELNPSRLELLKLAKPILNDLSLMIPSNYRIAFIEATKEFENIANQKGSEKIKKAAELLKEVTIDQEYLLMALSLLILV